MKVPVPTNAIKRHPFQSTPVWMIFGLAIAIATVSSSADETDIDEIVIVGEEFRSLRLRAESMAGGRLGLSTLETPATVEIISAADIRTKGDYGVLEAVTRSAGIVASASPGNGGTSVSSRGFNGHNSTLNTYDGTRLYIVAGTVTFPADTWTLDRVEVLHGAGSVINGVGALGSTINYVPKAPRFGESDFAIEGGAGSFGMRRLALGGGAELNDTWAYRVDASHYEADGFVDRAEEERDVVAGSLLFKPFEDLSVKLSVDYADIVDAPYWGTPLINGEASSSHRQNNYNFGDGSVEYEDVWARVRTDYEISDNVSFRNDTYLMDVRREWQNLEEYAYNAGTNQIDRAFYLGIIHDQNQLGTRSDFLIETSRNKLSIGADFNIIDLDYSNNFSTGGFGVADSVPVNGFNPGQVPSSTIPTILDYSTDTTQYAVFVDDQLQLTEQLSAVVGARYDTINYDRLDHAIGGSPASRFDTEFKEFTWRAGLVYLINESFSVYGQVSTAVDPVTSPISISAGNQDFEPSRGRQYEIGLKQQFGNGLGEYSIAYFDIEKKDIVTRRPASAVSEQIGQQSSSGIEFMLRVNPADFLTVDFNAAFVDAEFDEFFSGGVSLAGNTPRNVPEKTANLWLNLTPINKFQLGGGLRYVDERFADDSNSSTLPAYLVFDASAQILLADSTTLILRGRNLTDEEDYVLSEYTPNQWIFAEPRSYEASINFAF